MKNIPFKRLKAFEGLAITREIIKIAKYLRVALILVIVSAAVFVCSLLIITAYFLMHLIQGH